MPLLSLLSSADSAELRLTHVEMQSSPHSLPSPIRLSAAFQLRFVSLRSPDEHEKWLGLLLELRLQLQQGLSENSIFVCKNNQV